MAKILYPIGTRVVVKSVIDHSPLFVLEYHKGEEYPYRVGPQDGTPITVGNKSKFSVKGLKRYNPTQAKATDAGRDVEEAKCTEKKCAEGSYFDRQEVHNTYTQEEVDTLLHAVTKDFYRELEGIRQELYADILTVAKVSDRNFSTVSKKFKTLNHDDN